MKVSANRQKVASGMENARKMNFKPVDIQLASWENRDKSFVSFGKRLAIIFFSNELFDMKDRNMIK